MLPPGCTVTLQGRPGYGSCHAGTTCGRWGAAMVVVMPAATVSVAEPTIPSLVARIWAVPVATPTTNPDPDTVAIEGAALLYVIARPPSTLPWASRSVTDA